MRDKPKRSKYYLIALFATFMSDIISGFSFEIFYYEALINIIISIIVAESVFRFASLKYRVNKIEQGYSDQTEN